MKFCIFLIALLGFKSIGAQPMRVLFIGNSYTHYNSMPKLFEQMAESKGIKIDVVTDAKSNHTFKMHSQRPELYKSIKSHKWDYIVLQGFSRELAQEKETIDSASLPYIRQLLDSIYSNNACTNVLLFQTWGYENGFIDDSVGINWDYQTMADRIHHGYIYVGEQLKLGIVPVGKVWETVKENHNNILLYQDDKQHPSLAGSYLAASCFYSALFKSDSKVTFHSSLDSKIASTLQEIASAFIQMNKTRYRTNLNTVEIEVNISEDGKKVVVCKSNYPEATSVTWDFGDGMVETAFKTRHVYSKPKTYEIKIRVVDACGVRLFKRKITV
jgi:hypothetical protein